MSYCQKFTNLKRMMLLRNMTKNWFKMGVVRRIQCGTESASRPSIDDIETPLRMLKMVQSFRNRGHFAATLDPLMAEGGGRTSSWLPEDAEKHPDVVRMLRRYPAHLDLRPFQLETASLTKRYYLGNEIKSVSGQTQWTIPELVTFMCEAYCGSAGIEFAHVDNAEQRDWLKERIETGHGLGAWKAMTANEMITALERLIRCDLASEVIAQKLPATKVFGIEGCEVLIPGLFAIIETASALGVENVEMGMSHRGRLNVLHAFFQKSLHSIFNHLLETEKSDLGDVVYHLGTRAELDIAGTDFVHRKVRLSLEANPSHLEAVPAVVMGKTRAKQFFVKDTTMKRVMPIVLHGDAAFSGQGIVSEVMELSELPDYSVGGCIHIIINNQIGFTTDPRVARSSYHCTNVAKLVGAPIFHVNADDVEAVVAVCRLAAAWRQRFLRDCVVDLVCYRRHGHNSLDDPSITSPLTYAAIKTHRSVVQLFEERMIDRSVVNKEYCNRKREEWKQEYEADFKRSQSYTSDPMEWLASNWQGSAIGSMISGRPYNQTGVRLSTLQMVGRSLIKVPEDFEIHKDVQKLLKQREKIMNSGEGVTMALAESLAFGCLMSKYTPTGNISHSSDASAIGLGIGHNETDPFMWNDSESTSFAGPGATLGPVKLKEHPTVHIRLSGQDSIRGTFNQRHAAIYCQKTSRAYWQLNHMGTEQATLSVCNSSLAEAAILGFEYGYSLGNEMALTLWEAQFGDFANVAQSIIDNFVVSGEHKWNNKSSLVMLLPHGFDGQGPEHSSARLERYLQLVDDDPDNISRKNEVSVAEMEAGFDAIVGEVSRFQKLDSSEVSTQSSLSGGVTKAQFARALERYAPALKSERLDLAVDEMFAEAEIDVDSANGGLITKQLWCRLMGTWFQSHAERRINFIVAVPSTPAQYFHCLRRQIHRPFAKPLVVMNSKYLIHHKPCASRLQDMTTGTFFLRIIVEGSRGDNMLYKRQSPSDDAVEFSNRPVIMVGDLPLLDPPKIKRVIYCSGQIFYHLYHHRAKLLRNDITFVRIEQIAPFPYHLIEGTFRRFQNAELVWVQEEPKNMGAWSYVKPRFDTCIREAGESRRVSVRYVGRKPSASPASGGYSVHVKELKALLDEAMAFP